MDDERLKELSSAAYWNKRYDGSSSHEWFRTFSQLFPYLEKELPDVTSNPSILHLGCGDSVRGLPSVP